jgi:hypothetical protein
MQPMTAMCCVLALAVTGPGCRDSLLFARDYGLVGDGVTDDGPALQRALDALRAAPKPARLVFEPGATYRLKNGAEGTTADAAHTGTLAERYAAKREVYHILLEGLDGITLDGAGATFLVDMTGGRLGFLMAEACTDLAVVNLDVDYDPLPFADGTIISLDPEGRHVDVRVHDGFALPPADNPPRPPDEQAWFATVWTDGPHSPIGHHYWISWIGEAWPGSLAERVVRVTTESHAEWGASQGLDRVTEGKTTISLPIRGLAHRGGREAFHIFDNTNVRVEGVRVWSAPWFVFGITGNRGEAVFRKVEIRPRAGRLMSSWRDGMHVTANRARLLFEDCHFEGMNDDAFNIKTLQSSVGAVVSPTEIEITQVFSLSIVPWESGDTIEAYSMGGRRLLGRRTVVQAAGEQETDWSSGQPRSPRITLRLDGPIEGLEPGDRVWNLTSANPDTTLRRCDIRMSCRMQCPMTVEDCQVTALLWFHGNDIEGPLPGEVVVRDSVLRLGRGNPDQTLIVNAAIAPEPPSEPVIGRVVLQNNRITGKVRLEHAESLVLEGNRLEGTGDSILFGNIGAAVLRGNLDPDGNPLGHDRLTFADDAARAAVRIEP